VILGGIDGKVRRAGVYLGLKGAFLSVLGFLGFGFGLGRGDWDPDMHRLCYDTVFEAKAFTCVMIFTQLLFTAVLVL
jgi:hypothetical protein